MTPEGMTVRKSRRGPQQTADRFAAVAGDEGMTLLARIDHASAAAEAGLELRPTEVLILGNPRADTPLMKVAQTIGIDLPLRVLVWQDEEGQTWLGYNDPRWLARRHVADAGADRILAAMTEALATITERATADPARNAP